MTAWNKGLTKETSPALMRVSEKRKAWWAADPRLETRAKIGATSRGRSGPKGPDAYGWKGGRYTDSRDGYVLVRQTDHPNARGDGYVLEHRLVMESLIGRYLFPDEDVNHINGIKDDNRPENLMLVRHNAHYASHKCPSCGFDWATR